MVSQGPAPVDLDDWTGKPATQATQALHADGLTVKTTQKYNETVPAGNVISQTPRAGHRASR